jgi:hypothetical protein
LLLRQPSQSGYELYITDQKDEYVDEFIWSVGTETRNTKSLVDDPFTYERLSTYNFKYSILWLNNDKPFMGWFANQYNNLPSNVLRTFSRWYKLNSFKNLDLRFLREEHTMYREHLQPILEADNIDTIFFTRHLDANKDVGKWKNKKLTQLIMGDRADIKWIESRFRGVDQTIYYFSTWKFYSNIDNSFIPRLPKA